MPDRLIRTLIVENDLLVADAHRVYVQKVPGFIVSGVVHSGAESLRHVSRVSHDLILLDLQLPDIAGLEVCRILRSQNVKLDIMVITSARDLESLQTAVSFGAIQYLLKPFSFPAFQRSLERYATFRRRLTTPATGPVRQRDVDFALATLRPDTQVDAEQPKGLSAATLDAVLAQLRTAEMPVSADEIAEALSMSRVTARRYLQELTAQRLATQTHRYGHSGRPMHLYHWCGE
jgi:response regulator of citrate/malate metabolism